MAQRALRSRPIPAGRAGGRQPAEPAAPPRTVAVSKTAGFQLARHELEGWPRPHQAAGPASSLPWPARQPTPAHGGV